MDAGRLTGWRLRRSEMHLASYTPLPGPVSSFILNFPLSHAGKICFISANVIATRNTVIGNKSFPQHSSDPHSPDNCRIDCSQVHIFSAASNSKLRSSTVSGRSRVMQAMS